MLRLIKGTLSGMLKTIGAQFHAAIMNLIGFYGIALPIGLSLLLKSSLENFGKI